MYNVCSRTRHRTKKVLATLIKYRNQFPVHFLSWGINLISINIYGKKNDQQQDEENIFTGGSLIYLNWNLEDSSLPTILYDISEQKCIQGVSTRFKILFI